MGRGTDRGGVRKRNSAQRAEADGEKKAAGAERGPQSPEDDSVPAFPRKTEDGSSPQAEQHRRRLDDIGTARVPDSRQSVGADADLTDPGSGRRAVRMPANAHRLGLSGHLHLRAAFAAELLVSPLHPVLLAAAALVLTLHGRPPRRESSNTGATEEACSGSAGPGAFPLRAAISATDPMERRRALRAPRPTQVRIVGGQSFRAAHQQTLETRRHTPAEHEESREASRSLRTRPHADAKDVPANGCGSRSELRNRFSGSGPHGRIAGTALAPEAAGRFCPEHPIWRARPGV